MQSTRHEYPAAAMRAPHGGGDAGFSGQPEDGDGQRMRNLAVGALHLAGRHDSTEATRWASRKMDRPFTIPGLTS